MESESCQLTRFSSHCRKIHMFFPDWFYQANARKKLQIFKYGNMICISKWLHRLTRAHSPLLCAMDK